MPIIEKIEIKNFRSFGNRKKETVQIAKISDLNIFSGSNDSGKSNILRALNLFFNNKVGLDSELNFERDFHKKGTKHENDVKEELITIKIWFNNENNKNKNRMEARTTYLPEKFRVSRKWKRNSINFSELSSIENEFKSEKGEDYQTFLDEHGNLKSQVHASLQKQLTDFINSIQFQYVPAIKDKSYFSYLYGELQKTLWKVENSQIESRQNAFEHEIQEETKKLMEEFKSSITETINLKDTTPFFQLPSNLVDFFKTLKVNTGDIDLDLRGDGIQAKLIPEILYFIAQKEKSYKQNRVRKGEKLKKYFIWAFEEPENSYEYKNAQSLAERFSKVFSKSVQIFITTHSFNFLSLNGTHISKYRVRKDGMQDSRIRLLKTTTDGLFKRDIASNNFVDDELSEELGVFEMSNALKILYEEKEKELQNMREIRKKLTDISNILFIEDSHSELYKVARLKLNDIPFTKDSLLETFETHANFSIVELGGHTEIKKKIEQKVVFECRDKKIIALFDFDKAYDSFNGLKSETWSDILGQETTCLYKKRNDHNNFYAILLPVPGNLLSQASKEYGSDSVLTIELLLDFENQVIKNYYKRKPVVGGGSITEFKGKKKKFWEKLINLPKESFENFKPLFDFIKDVFGD